MKLVSIAAAVALAMTLAATPAVANAAAGETCPAGERLQIGGMSIQPCHSTIMAQPVVGDLSANYGRVALQASSGGVVDIDKGVGRYLRALIGINTAFDAAVSIEVVQAGGVIYQRPLLTISVAKGDKSKAELSSFLTGDTAISPYYVLPNGLDGVTARIKVSAISTRGSKIADTVKKGVDAGAALGGHGWLVTGFANETFTAFLKLNESALNSYYSDDLKSTIDADLKFDGASAYKVVTYKITLPPAKEKGEPTNVTATVTLTTRPSLLTDRLMTVDGGSFMPDWRGIPQGRWASSVKLLNNKTFASVVDSGGLPQKLMNLQLPDGARPDDVVARKTQVNNDCLSLSKQITNGDFQLNPFDRAAVLLDELKSAGVFKVYAATDLVCTNDMVPIWTHYGLPVPPPPETKPVFASSPQQRVDRLTLLAKHWALKDAPTRQEFLPYDFTNPVQLSARFDFIPGYPAPTTPDLNGLATWPVQPTLLAALTKSCLGNFKPPPEKENWATGFVMFENDPRSYLLTATFDDSTPVGSEGPRITALLVREATPQDRNNYDLNGKCLH